MKKIRMQLAHSDSQFYKAIKTAKLMELEPYNNNIFKYLNGKKIIITSNLIPELCIDVYKFSPRAEFSFKYGKICNIILSIMKKTAKESRIKNDIINIKNKQKKALKIKVKNEKN